MAMTNFTNTLIHGDCLEILPEIPAGSIDMILCDPPYGVTRNGWDRPIRMDALWPEIWRVLKPSGACVMTGHGLFTARLILSCERYFRYKWVWMKSKAVNFLNAKKQPLRKHEDICVFYRKPPVYNPQMTKGEPYDRGTRKNQLSGSYGDYGPVHIKSKSGLRLPADIIHFPTAEAEGPVRHPTQKPVALGRYLVRTYTNPGETVLDFAFGSGSFPVAALMEGRNFIGIELNRELPLFKKDSVDCFSIAESRLKAAWKGLSRDMRQFIRPCGLAKRFAEEKD